MSDAEHIYSLYVQANPVPDPDTLPPTMDEALLPITERSGFMDTRVRTEISRAKRRPRWRVAAVAFAAVGVVGALGGIVWVMSNDDGQPVAAEEASPEIVFDGAACTYSGPARIVEGNVEFSITNRASVAFAAAGILMQEPALQAELQRTPIGEDMALELGAPLPDGQNVFVFPAAPGETATLPATLSAGTYLVDCVTYEGPSRGRPDHVWRAATIEITAP